MSIERSTNLLSVSGLTESWTWKLHVVEPNTHYLPWWNHPSIFQTVSGTPATYPDETAQGFSELFLENPATYPDEMVQGFSELFLEHLLLTLMKLSRDFLNCFWNSCYLPWWNRPGIFRTVSGTPVWSEPCRPQPEWQWFLSVFCHQCPFPENKQVSNKLVSHIQAWCLLQRKYSFNYEWLKLFACTCADFIILIDWILRIRHSEHGFYITFLFKILNSDNSDKQYAFSDVRNL